MSDHESDFDDIGPFEMEIRDPLGDILDCLDRPDEAWLWCIFCKRFFQAKHLRIDFLGNRQGCAFCNCAGFDCAIFMWDTFAEDPDWPKSEAELRHGVSLTEI